MHTCEKPIGILDSGIGGFSVARAVQRLLPEEELLYFGDGAHVPYGNHGAEEIADLTRYMLAFMKSQGVKALLVACNTVCCVLDRCRDEICCPAFNIVQAGADAAAGMGAERVGVLSTVFTHSVQAYPREILAHAPERLEVFSRGCSDLARLVEHNLGDPAGMARVEEELQKELGPLVERDRIQCCVLGCTHYPLVAGSIRKLYPGLPLIDPAEEMARSLAAYLREHGLERRGAPGWLSVYTTGDVKEYALRARQVGLERVKRVEFYPPMEL